MSDRTFQCLCQKCGRDFEFTGSYEKFNEFLKLPFFSCSGGHKENSSPRTFLKVLGISEPAPVVEWKAEVGRNYVDILNVQTARVMGMQIEHLGSGLYIDRRTRKKYDYEEDSKGTRHYFELLA